LQGDTPLVFAAGQGQTELVSLLVSRGAKINARSNDGSSALNVAMFPPHDDTARLLLKLGAEHDIFSASAMGLMDKVKSIIRADKNAVNKSTVGGYTALHWAVGQDKLEMVKLLVNSGADVNALPHGYPFSPLFIARQKKFKAVDDWLVSKGATMEGDRDAWPERTPEEFATQPTTRPAE
jgi:ankyrin repeat protein